MVVAPAAAEPVHAPVSSSAPHAEPGIGTERPLFEPLQHIPDEASNGIGKKTITPNTSICQFIHARDQRDHTPSQVAETGSATGLRHKTYPA